MVASDGIAWEGGKSHPRSAGCFSRFLGQCDVDSYCLPHPLCLFLWSTRGDTAQGGAQFHPCPVCLFLSHTRTCTHKYTDTRAGASPITLFMLTCAILILTASRFSRPLRKRAKDLGAARGDPENHLVSSATARKDVLLDEEERPVASRLLCRCNGF